MSNAPDPGTTLLLVLGASEFPTLGVRSSTAFEAAAKSLCSYFLSDIGFRMPIENLFFFFNSRYDPSNLDDQISTRIQTRVEQLKADGRPAKDLIVYYVGHGSFDEQRRYYLALKSTREANQIVSSLRLEGLMVTLHRVAHSVRKYLIIDACFAAESALCSQSGIGDAVRQEVRRLPQKGTLFLCSSSRDLISEFLPDETNTVFSRALSECLWEGHHELPSKISFEHLRNLIEDKLIESGRGFMRPEIHMPEQPEGDLAKIEFFPNGPMRVSDQLAEGERVAQEERLAAYFREQEAEQTRRAMKIENEQRAREEEIRQQYLAEQALEKAERERRQMHYGSEDEKRFREEAETAQDRVLNSDLLLDWLNWKSNESKITAGALRHVATDHDEEEQRNEYYAANIWDAASKQSKSGSDQYAQGLLNHWRELKENSRLAQRKAVSARHEAEDADAAAQFYADKMLDIDFLDRAAVSAQNSGQSFQQIVNLKLLGVVRHTHLRRLMKLFRQRCTTWARRITIGIIIFTVLVLIRQCDMYLGNSGSR